MSNSLLCPSRGLLSAHILAEYIQKEAKYMMWYRGELLEMAKDLGYRLLPAFNTSTGIPHARVKFPLINIKSIQVTFCNIHPFPGEFEARHENGRTASFPGDVYSLCRHNTLGVCRPVTAERGEHI